MDEGQYRKYGIPKQADLIIASYYKSVKVAGHPDFKAAKAGDVAAAARLVVDLVKPETVDRVRDQVKDAIFVAPHAIEKTGYNQIPNALANYYAVLTDGTVDDLIIQSSKAYHTGAGAMERLISRVTFEGEIEKGRQYVLVDDVTTMGGTLAELNNFIYQGGGEVGGIVTLTNASRAHNLVPQKNLIQEIERRYGNECRQLFGIEPKALTAAEAGYIISFRNAESLRKRALKAEQEKSERFLSKGLQASEKEITSLSPSEKNYKQQMLERGIEVHFPGKTPLRGYYMGEKNLDGRRYSVIDSIPNQNNRISYMIPFSVEHKDLMRFRAVQFDGAKIQYPVSKSLEKNLSGKGLER
jgi:hypothetical protein